MSRGSGGVAVAPVALHKFTVDEYHKMAEAGIFSEDDRVELLDGEIVEMTPIGPAHAACVDGLGRFLVVVLGDRAVVRVQGPIQLDQWSEPQPDLALLTPPGKKYWAAHPTPGDVLLVIEVADSTLAHDRSLKLPLYAAGGIPEAWLVNLVERRVEVYRAPSADGYKAIRYAVVGDTISPLAFPDLVLKVDEILM